MGEFPYLHHAIIANGTIRGQITVSQAPQSRIMLALYRLQCQQVLLRLQQLHLCL
jgi:hypothetical protein